MANSLEYYHNEMDDDKINQNEFNKSHYEHQTYNILENKNMDESSEDIAYID